MKPILFDERNVGKQVWVRGMLCTIGEILSSKSHFRTQEEVASGGAIMDYRFDDITSAKNLILSFDNGEKWVSVNIDSLPSVPNTTVNIANGTVQSITTTSNEVQPVPPKPTAPSDLGGVPPVPPSEGSPT